MPTESDRPVLVAVESAGTVEAALAFAEQEARRSGCGLLLLHVISHAALVPSEAYPWEGFQEPAEAMLAALADQVEARVDGEVPVRWEVTYGSVVRTVVERSADSRMVVLQGEAKGRLGRLVTGQVRNGVAARAHSPVVCVPSDWSTDADGALVVAGLDDPDPDPGLVRAALAVATERGAGIRFIHAWWFTEPLDDTMFTKETAREWTVRMQGRLRREVERVVEGPDSPSVPDSLSVEVKAVHERPADALLEQSRHATLLVLGRHDPRFPFGSHLGPVVRAVLRAAACPVMVVRGGPDHGQAAVGDE